MGDVLHALPAVSALRAALPAAQIGWAIEPRWEALLRDSDGRMPLVDAIHPVETRLWRRQPLSRATLASLMKLRSGLRARRYDVCVDLQGSMRSAVIGRLAGAREFFGPEAPRERPARLLYGRRVAVTAAHVVEQAAQMVSVALAGSIEPVSVSLPHDAAAEAWWARKEGEGVVERPFVFLVPQAGWGAKQWPTERFGALARQLARAGFRVLVNHSHAEDSIAGAVVAAAGGAATAVAADLPQLLALTRRAALVVAGDTGPLHLAAALGRPVLGLFGPTDPARTGPYTARARVLRHPLSVTDHSRHEATEGGLLQITTETVLDAALELLREGGPEHRA